MPRQWLDIASAQMILFVGRRILAERIALVCAARTVDDPDVLVGLPELRVAGLGTDDARALLLSNLKVPFDTAVCGRIVAESHGNPLALLELPRSQLIAGACAFGVGQRGVVAAQAVVDKCASVLAERRAPFRHRGLWPAARRS